MEYSGAQAPLGATKDRWTRRFSVGPAAPNPRGFTLYRLTSYVFPNASPEAITVVTIWKRFRDLHKLQRKIKKIHQSLHLRGQCPEYAKWSYFKRFELEVLEERIKTSQQLLDFIALHSQLFTSTDFVNFFQSSYPDPNSDHRKNPPGRIEEIRNSLLLPVDIMKPLEYQSSEEDSYSMTDSMTVSTIDSMSLNSSIVNRDISQCVTLSQLINNIQNENEQDSLSNSNDNVDTITVSSTENITNHKIETTKDIKCSIENVSYKTNLPDLLSFNSLNINDKQNTLTKSGDNTNSIDSSFDINDMKRQIGLNNNSKFYNSDLSLQNDSSECSSGSFDQMVKSAKNKPQHLNYCSNNVSQFQNNSSNLVSIGSDLQKKSFASVDDSNISKSNVKFNLQENYVFEAGYLLSLGAKNEAKNDYETAFDCYKLGIEKLLIGVQDDVDEFRKQFVKDKISKYLTHTEKIYKYFINVDDDYAPSETTNSISTNISENKFLHRDYCEPYQNLSKYRVLRIISGQVMLVLDSESQECYAMKVIQKSCNSVSDDEYLNRGNLDGKLPILPINIPYMVKLKSYIETPNLLFIVVQYASGGKLFEYLRNHSKSVPNTPAREVNLENVFVDLKNLKKINDVHSITKNEGNGEKCTSDVKPLDLDKLDISVNEMVINSQKLLLNVDEALSGNFSKIDGKNILNNKNDSNTLSQVEDKLDGIQEKLQKIETNICTNIPITCALPPKSICKWGAELLLAIEHLHRHDVICWTLQPENILLGERGHVTLTYFVSRELQDVLLPFLNNCNSGPICNVYIAPELLKFPVLKKNEFNERVCDFWSFGAVMYELIVGMSLSTMHPTGFNSHTILSFPDDLHSESKSFLSQLLTYNPKERLGSGPTEIEEIKNHPYFNSIDWEAIIEDSV